MKGNLFPQRRPAATLLGVAVSPGESLFRPLLSASGLDVSTCRSCRLSSPTPWLGKHSHPGLCPGTSLPTPVEREASLLRGAGHFAGAAPHRGQRIDCGSAGGPAFSPFMTGSIPESRDHRTGEDRTDSVPTGPSEKPLGAAFSVEEVSAGEAQELARLVLVSCEALPGPTQLTAQFPGVRTHVSFTEAMMRLSPYLCLSPLSVQCSRGERLHGILLNA